MDDMQEIYKNNEQLFNLEKTLCKRADILISSADYLKQKLIKRYNLNRKIDVINNASAEINSIDENISLPPKIQDIFSTTETKKLVYIGTISNWFDFDLMIKIVANNKNIALVIFGPFDTIIPEHERIIYHKPVEHKYIFSIMQKADALIMPFKLNELVKSVNPVKAYEYIYSGKPVILRKYNETEKFEDFCYLYETFSDLIKLIQQLPENKLIAKQERQNCIRFIENNTWDKRVKSILKLISDKK